jgi:probable rRNA maturation factor
LISFSTNEIKFRLKNKAQVREWLELFTHQAGFTIDNLSIVFCSDEFLLEMNRTYLNHDYFTDIISFDYSNKERLSGELFISIDRIKENAHERNLLFNDEILRVIAHGVLHLMGYKDKTKKEAVSMRQAEDTALFIYNKQDDQNLN